MRSSRPLASPCFHNFVESGKDEASMVKVSKGTLLSDNAPRPGQRFEIGRHLPYHRIAFVISEKSRAASLQLRRRVQSRLSFVDECWASARSSDGY